MLCPGLKQVAGRTDVIGDLYPVRSGSVADTAPCDVNDDVGVIFPHHRRYTGGVLQVQGNKVELRFEICEAADISPRPDGSDHLMACAQCRPDDGSADKNFYRGPVIVWG